VSEDSVEIDRLMGRFLRAVSFKPGGRPAYDDLRELFSEGARLIKNSEEAPEIATVDEFIAPRRASVDAGELTSFEEIEVADVTEIFGNVAHRFSTYEKRGTTTSARIRARGMISTQFIRTPSGWRMSSMAWDDERPGLELPARYEA
jgi:hypothetical protein